jgi:hypothetical protein
MTEIPDGKKDDQKPKKNKKKSPISRKDREQRRDNACLTRENATPEEKQKNNEK